MASFSTPQSPAKWIKGTQEFNVQSPLLKPIRYLITGITKDSAGVALGNCIINVYETISAISLEPKGRLVNMTTSDSNGNYSVEVHSNPRSTFQVEAYKAGGTDVAGVTVNTLTPTIS